METAGELHINLRQKFSKKITTGNNSKFTQILEQLVTQKRRGTLAAHISTLGPEEWNLTGDRIMGKNSMI
jgi:hypothetical protein